MYNLQSAKSRIRVTSRSESQRNFESLQHSDILPYAISDHYDKIEELNIADESTTESEIIFLPKRTGLLPTPGYAGLTSVKQIVPPSVYCRMKSHEPEEDENGSRKKLPVLANVPGGEESAALFDKGVSQCEYNEASIQEVGSDIYLTPVDDWPNKNTHSADANHSYLELSEEEDK